MTEKQHVQKTHNLQVYLLNVRKNVGKWGEAGKLISVVKEMLSKWYLTLKTKILAEEPLKKSFLY